MELNALDLGSLDLRNLDPSLAQKMLDEIRGGADIALLLEKLRANSRSSSVQFPQPPKRDQMVPGKEKVVTFDEETKVTSYERPEEEEEEEDEDASRRSSKLGVGDVFM